MHFLANLGRVFELEILTNAVTMYYWPSLFHIMKPLFDGLYIETVAF